MSEMEQVCRTCAKNSSYLIPLTSTIIATGYEHKLYEIYTELTTLSVRYPFQICNLLQYNLYKFSFLIITVCSR